MADYDLQYQDNYIDALLATANELKNAGFIYKGVATPSTNPGTPTERVAYLASEPGTYTNFGGIVIASGLYSLTYAGGTWTGTQISAGSVSLEDCTHQFGGTAKKIVKVKSADFANQNSNFVGNAIKYRLSLNAYKLIDVRQCTAIKAVIPYSAVSADTKMDRVTIPMYDKDKAIIAAADLGWSMFNHADVTINVDLTEARFADVRYIGLYFGCASTSTTLNYTKLNTDNIVIELTLNDSYHAQAAEEDDIFNNENESSFTLNDLKYTSVAFNLYLRGVFIVDVRMYDEYNVQLSVAAGSTIKGSVQGWLEYDKNSTISDSTWITAGNSYALSRVEGVKYIAILATYTSNNTGIPTLAEIAQYFTFSFTGFKKGIAERVLELESAQDVATPYNWREQLTTTSYNGDKINLGDNTYTFSTIGTLQSGTSSRQGGAAYGDFLFQFHNTLATICVFNMSTGVNVQKLTLTAMANCHAGSGGFSRTFYDANDPFPLLYISSMDEKKIYVYRLTGAIGSLSISKIQTITLTMEYYLPNITIDAENDKIVIFAYTQNSWDDATNNKSVIMSCPIPSHSADVTITQYDGEFLVPFIIAEQGAFARLGKLYMSYGNTAPEHNEGGIIVIDYVGKSVTNLIGLRAIGELEPEACVKWNDSIVITTQTGVVYKLDF
jgi:hypothetical protein